MLKKIENKNLGNIILLKLVT